MWIVFIAIAIILIVIIIARFDSKNEIKLPVDPEPDYENRKSFEITGVHIEGRKKYIINYCSIFDEIELIHEPNNKFSKRAIVVKHNGRKIGYIPEYDVEEVHEIIKRPYEANIDEINYYSSYLSVQAMVRFD